MSQRTRGFSRWLAFAAAFGLLQVLATGPAMADSSRKTMGSSRKTMRTERATMSSTRRTGAESVRRGSMSANRTTTRGGYTASTTGQSEPQKIDTDSTALSSEPEASAYEDWSDSDPARGGDPYRGFEGDWPEESLAERAEREEAERRERFRNRTLGKACMYGAGGRVLYRPRGVVCEGDPEPARPLRTAPSTAATAATAATTPAAPAPADASSGCAGRCMYGAGGRILYAPPGCDC